MFHLDEISKFSFLQLCLSSCHCLTQYCTDVIPAAEFSCKVLMAKPVLPDLLLYHLVLWNVILISSIVLFLSSPVLLYHVVLSVYLSLNCFSFFYSTLKSSVEMLSSWNVEMLFRTDTGGWSCDGDRAVQGVSAFSGISIFWSVCKSLCVCVSVVGAIHITISLFCFLPAGCTVTQAWCERVTESVKC